MTEKEDAEEETKRLRNFFESQGYRHAPEFEGDDFIFPKSTRLTPEEERRAQELQDEREKNSHKRTNNLKEVHLKQKMSDLFDFRQLLPPHKIVERTEDQKIKEDYYHLLGFNGRTICGIDTLTSLTKDEGGQWRDGASPEKFSEKPCPRCIKIQQERGDAEAESTF